MTTLLGTSSHTFKIPSLSCLLVLVLCCGVHGSLAYKPTIPRPADAHFTTVLTVDSGGLRGVISAYSLVMVENIIKEYIHEKRKDLFPEGAAITSIEEFEVSLADYIDCFAGISAGSWIVSYLASKGGNGISANIFAEKRFRQQYGEVAPGSARGLLILFHEYGNTIFPQEQTVVGGYPTSTEPTDPGVVTPVFSDEGLDRVLIGFIGNTKLSELHTSCLIPAYDLLNRVPVWFIHDAFHVPARVGVARHIHRPHARSLASSFLSDIQFTGGLDFYIREVSEGSAAAPITYPAKRLNSIDKSNTSFLLVDGYMGGGTNPTLQALAFVLNTTESASFENITVLSFGPGHAFGDYSDNANGGVAQWVASGDFFNILVASSGEILHNQIDVLFYSNPKVKPGQLFRISTFDTTESMEGNALGALDRFVDLPTLENIGRRVAAEHRSALVSYVESFIFG